MKQGSGTSRWARQVGVTLVELGLDLRRWLALGQAPRFLADRRRFLRAGGRIDHLAPMLSDYLDQAGAARGHYFHQDLLVATLINRAAPRRHIDVGSRVDGFVAHVAAFRPIEVMDIRPLALVHDRISVLQRDLMAGGADINGITDSLSCLHALEHFGLGRYGDPIDPDGHLKGFAALHAMLEPGGTLYLSFPIGEPGVHFNAHRVFAPGEVLGWLPGAFDLIRFDFVDDAGDLHADAAVGEVPALEYGCGIYTLCKRAPADA